MDLKSLQRHWDGFARLDALWSNLTAPDKSHRAWDAEAFFHTGEDEIEAVLVQAPAGLPRQRRRALDFGCGAGRLSQALARRFERCDGVDISTEMIAKAREHNALPERCFYHLNEAEDLSLFPDAAFDLVYTVLVLQHMEPRYSTGYLREFVRVLAPGGLLVFQLPSRYEPAPAAPPAGPRSLLLQPLARAAFRARIEAARPALAGVAHAHLDVAVRVTNASALAWPALGAPDARFQVMLANRWRDEQGRLVLRDDARQALPHDLEPGHAAELELTVRLPPAAGDYQLELDMVQESVCWFQERGSATQRLPCHVDPAPGQAPAPSLAPLAEDTGASGAGSALRRALARTPLGAGWRALRRELAWRRGLRQRTPPPRFPLMEMHPVPSERVEAVLAEAGARLLRREEEKWADGFVSCRYWATR